MKQNNFVKNQGLQKYTDYKKEKISDYSMSHIFLSRRIEIKLTQGV